MPAVALHMRRQVPPSAEQATGRDGGEGQCHATMPPEVTAARLEVAVLVPCYNEEHAIAKVVADFRAALPEATIYVYDNNSTDDTVEAARRPAPCVRRESHQGKGHVVRRMFNDVEADIYVLVDGDATYDAPSAPADDRQAPRRAARHGGRHAHRSR